MSIEVAVNEVGSGVVRPFMYEFPYRLPSDIFRSISGDPWSILLDSADQKQDCQSYGTNRYSYIGFDPFKKIELKSNQLRVGDEVLDVDDMFDILKSLSSKYILERYSDKPIFQGGLMGFLSYDLCQYLEKIPPSENVDDEIEIASIGLYDLVHAFDHKLKKSWIFSSGFPHLDSECRAEHARLRLEQYLEKIECHNIMAAENKKVSGIHSNFTRDQYISAVNQAINYIKAGDIFEVNLSQRFEANLPENFSAYRLFESIKEHNPSPFSAYFNLGGTTIISCSPERFLEVKDGEVETRPIKGTRRRGMTLLEDRQLAQDLIECEKDRAENIMIVDLMRNDLSAVCKPESVKVPQLCGHEVYPHVHHLVSVIKGKLKEDKTVFDLLKVSFPGGSITGAPKVRAMEIISALEPNGRGPYCGSLFYASFDGQSMDSSILIRTYVVKNNTITFHGGGAVTIASNPLEEYEETLSKVAALKYVLEGVE